MMIQVRGGREPRRRDMPGLFEVVDGVIVFSPDRDHEARAFGDRPRVAFAPVVAFGGMPDAITRAVRADAYASDQRLLASAIAYAASEDRAARSAGPLRVVYLGPLGEERASAPIGHRAIVGERILIGRSESCAVCLRQGGHSDQNTTSRHHTAIAPTGRGTVLVTDLKSTNGTWVRDHSITAPTEVAPGEEIAIAIGHRLRIDGRERSHRSRS